MSENTQTEAPSEREALAIIAAFPITDEKNMDAVNMRDIARRAIVRSALASQPQASTDESVTPEYLAWLATLYPRNGVGGNEAWNAGVAWALASQPQAVDAEDAERLDWLDAQNLRFRMGWQVSKALPGNVSVKSVIFTGTQPPVSIRAAIDAARRAGGAE